MHNELDANMSNVAPGNENERNLVVGLTLGDANMDPFPKMLNLMTLNGRSTVDTMARPTSSICHAMQQRLAM
jgi:hypothetical protein